jgi:hypothetical protein
VDAWNVSSLGQLGGITVAVAVQGSYAYIQEGPRLTILDVSDPAAPAVAGRTAPMSYNVYGVCVAGGYAFVGNSTAGLRVVDVSDPAAPFEAGFYDTPGSAYGVAVAGAYAYVADRYSGLRAVDVSDPSAPIEVGYFNTPGQAWRVAVAAELVYVSDYVSGLAILRFPASISAVVPLSGGGLFSEFDQTTYTFPAATFDNTVVVTHSPRLPGGVPPTGERVGIDHFHDVTAVYSESGLPAEIAPGRTYTVTVRYTSEEVGSVPEESLGFWSWSGGGWVMEPSSVVDTVNNVVTATPSHLSLWGVLGETRQSVCLPLVLRAH